jgi:signal transduction histidine kinase
MLADSDRLLHTVEQVLRAGQAGHKRRRLSPTTIDLGQIVRECLELTRVRYNLGPESLSLVESKNADRARVVGDAEDLRAAISNLLDNAIKYSDRDVQIKVDVGAVDDKLVAVRITDSGIGIPPGQLKRIFKRFYRAPGLFMARVKGTGLGLFIVHSIVARHGGRVFAESAGVGQGSTFTIQLPRAGT